MIRHLNVFKIGIVLLLLFLFIELPGCAKGNDPDNFSLDIYLDIQFGSAINTSQYNYYIIFSNSSLLLVPDPTQQVYFPTPGRLFDPAQENFIVDAEGNIENYYDSYFSTWSDYVLVSNGQFQLYNSASLTGFASKTNSTNSDFQPNLSFSNDAAFNDRGSITLSLQLSRSFLSTSSSPIYVSIATSRRDTIGLHNGTGLLLDRLEIPIEIPIQVFEDQTGFDSGNDLTESDKSAEITQWQVRIF